MEKIKYGIWFIPNGCIKHSAAFKIRVRPLYPRRPRINSLP